MSEETIYLQSDVDLLGYKPPEAKTAKPEAKNPAEAKQHFREEGIDGVWEHTPPKKRGFHESF